MKAMTFGEVDPKRVPDLIQDDSWVAEQKMDGARLLIHVSPTGETEFLARNGEPMKFAAAKQHFDSISTGVRAIGKEYVLDGEMMPAEGTFRCFDFYMPDKPHASYLGRRIELRESLHYLIQGNWLIPVPIFASPQAKRDFLKRAEKLGVEGVVFKNIQAPYVEGFTRQVLKHKFVKSADVILVEVDRPDPKHGSAKLGVFDNGELRVIGSCSMIGKPDVPAGTVVEVAYLYWTGDAMIQPRLTHVRHDKAAQDCTVAQFPAYTRDIITIS